MSEQQVPTVEDILQRIRRNAIMARAIDPSAPDPEAQYQRLSDLARRYPPTLERRGDEVGYDFAPLIAGAARESGQDEHELAEAFLRGAKEGR